MALADSAGMRDLAELKSRVRAFVAERDWERFHSPKNLAMALSVEASELVELFQWLTEEESGTLDAAARGRVAQELADVLWFLGRLEDARGRTELAARLFRSAVEGFVVTHDDRGAEVADELVAMLRRTGQDDRVQEFRTWQSGLVETVTGAKERTTTPGRRRAPAPHGEDGHPG